MARALRASLKLARCLKGKANGNAPKAARKPKRAHASARAHSRKRQLSFAATQRFIAHRDGRERSSATRVVTYPARLATGAGAAGGEAAAGAAGGTATALSLGFTGPSVRRAWTCVNSAPKKTIWLV
jgi:hypothetical protein